jgi:hypothetical protein
MRNEDSVCLNIFNPLHNRLPLQSLYTSITMALHSVVQFHPLLVTSISRKPSNAELFMAYNHQFHAASCRKCKQGAFCHVSERIAKSITDRLTAGPDGKIYSITGRDRRMKVRVEMPSWLSIHAYLQSEAGSSGALDDDENR